MKITAEPRSDQWNADDFIGGPRTFTIAGVKAGTAEQKYDIELVEGEGRWWRPPLTMLRLLIAAWGDEAATWVGRRVTLYRDPKVRFGSDEVGGIRVSHLSHLPDGKPLSAMLTSTRGRRARVSVDPLPDAPPAVPPSGAAPQGDPVEKMLAAFSALGVSEAQLVAKLGRPRAEWSADDVTSMKGVYMAIKDSPAAAAEAFPPPAAAPPGGERASESQLARLVEIRAAEKLDDDGSWFEYIHGATGARVTTDADLTPDQAQEVIDIFNTDNAAAADKEASNA